MDFTFLNNKISPIKLNGITDLFNANIVNSKIIQFYGDTSSGKTAFMLDIIKNNLNKSFVFIDTKNQLVNRHLESFNNVTLLLNNDADIILNVLKDIINYIDVIIIDDISFITSNLESYESKNYSILLSNFLKELTFIINNKRIIVLVTNQSVNYNNINTYKMSNIYFFYSAIFNISINNIYTSIDNKMEKINIKIENKLDRIGIANKILNKDITL